MSASVDGNQRDESRPPRGLMRAGCLPIAATALLLLSISGSSPAVAFVAPNARRNAVGVEQRTAGTQAAASRRRSAEGGDGRRAASVPEFVPSPLGGRHRHRASNRSSPARAALAASAPDAAVDPAVGGGVASVAFVSGSAPSGYGRTSPEPEPAWSIVAPQLSRRIPNFGGYVEDDDDGGIGGGPGSADRIRAESFEASSLDESDLGGYDVVVALGVSTEEEERRLRRALEYAASGGGGGGGAIAVLADPTCGAATLSLRRAGSYRTSSVLDGAIASVTPWSSVASGRRLMEKADSLLSRKSSEDHIFAVLFAVHALVTELDVVRSDINPSWEKGPIRNALEFKSMVDCCGPEIKRALADPKTKKAIDLLNAVDLRDQVGSYRVIVSNETPELEEFTLCILQQNNCFGCDSPILDRPAVPLLERWRGETLSPETARQIMIGHLDHPSANLDCSKREPWSWKVVVGANPAYDAFPMQHQIFYPSGSGGSSLWYDPVFCVETLDDEKIWCKRHYRCTPRSADPSGRPTPGAWSLNTLDNGMVSEERWTTVDAADDLSWAVLHYSGAARRAGQSYVGALLCSPDGKWPELCGKGTEGYERIREAIRSCDLEMWELFGGSAEESFMWSGEYTEWAVDHPPPLERIGDVSITTWRRQEREKALLAKIEEK